MKTLTLTAENHVIDSLLLMLDNFSQQEIVKVETIEQDYSESKHNSMADLAGILAPYAQGYVSDEEMEQAITDAISERAMLK